MGFNSGFKGLKYSVLIVAGRKYTKCNIWRVAVRPSYIQDARFLKVKFRSKFNAISLGFLSKKIFQNTRVRALFRFYTILRLYIVIIGYVYAASADIRSNKTKFHESVNILININSYEGYSTSKIPQATKLNKKILLTLEFITMKVYYYST